MTVSRVAIQAAVAQLAVGKIFADSNGLMISNSGLKIVTATHDVSLTGDQAITGAGFAPAGAIVLAIIPNTTGNMSIGLGETSTSNGVCLAAQSTAGQYSYGTATIINLLSGIVQGAAVIKSWDSDGITLTWSKSGSPTGTAQILIMFLR